MANYAGCYTAVERTLGKAFAVYGRIVARHPWKFILIGVLANCLLGIGWLTLDEEKSIVAVFTPINSQSKKEVAKLKDGLFPDLSGSEYYTKHNVYPADPVVWLMAYAKTGNVLQRTVLEEVARLYKEVIEFSFNKGGTVVSYTDICAVRNSTCVVTGDFLFSKQFMDAVEANQTDFPVFLHSTRGPIYYGQAIALPVLDESGRRLQSTPGLMLSFNIRTNTSDAHELGRQWEKEFLTQIPSFSSEVIDIAYSHSVSVDEELDENVKGDILLFAVTIAIMTMYAGIASYTARHDCVGQRVLLGTAGVLAAALALLSSFGLVSACGVKFVSIVGVLPFLMIGIGVDDMFILMSGITHAPYDLSVEDRVGEMMRTSGVAITITSLTSMLAFAAGSTSSLLGVRNFCIYTGVAVLFCYINQATIFVASVALNERRSASNRHSFTLRKTKSKEEFEHDGKSSAYVFCCAGSPPKSEREAESCLDRFPKFLFPKLVRPMPLKILILLLFAAYLAISIWGLTLMKEGLNLQNLLHDSSYAHTFTTRFENDFQDETQVAFIIDTPLTYADPEIQRQIEDLLTRAKADTYIQDEIEISWLSDYKKSSSYSNATEASFIAGLQVFLSQEENKRYENDVVIDSSNSAIVASRVYVVSKAAASSQDNAELIVHVRAIARDSQFSVFAFAPRFTYYEQYLVILPQTLQTMGIAIGMVFVVTLIFMPHPLFLALIVTTVAMITAGIFGFLAHLDLTLSSITMIQIIMSIGFSVDFTAHVIHGYMIAQRRTREEKVEQALIQSGAPVFHGAASSFIGVLVLSTAQSFIFKTFFKLMSLVIGFGIAHALLFLPVVLSFLGPLSNSDEVDTVVKQSPSQSPEEATKTRDKRQRHGQPGNNYFEANGGVYYNYFSYGGGVVPYGTRLSHQHGGVHQRKSRFLPSLVPYKNPEAMNPSNFSNGKRGEPQPYTINYDRYQRVGHTLSVYPREAFPAQVWDVNRGHYGKPISSESGRMFVHGSYVPFDVNVYGYPSFYDHDWYHYPEIADGGGVYRPQYLYYS